MNRIVLALLVISLTGCAGERLQRERQQLAGQPEPYKDGYVQGCSTGMKAAGNPYYSFQKDATRFASDAMYSQGWNDGYGICKADYDSLGQMMRR